MVEMGRAGETRAEGTTSIAWKRFGKPVKKGREGGVEGGGKAGG